MNSNGIYARSDAIIACHRCERLRSWCQKVAEEKRAAYQHERYWGLPVPDFGDPDADRLIVGLAPAAHGANRTGRMFTGDRSGDWLYRALYKAGCASQPTSLGAEDGLILKGVLITAAVHCAPPDNKPTLEELHNCGSYLIELLTLKEWKSILCLGGLSWMHTHRALVRIGNPTDAAVRFGHLATASTAKGTTIVGCYHPSQQNTFTGRLTEEMLDEAIQLFLSS